MVKKKNNKSCQKLKTNKKEIKNKKKIAFQPLLRPHVPQKINQIPKIMISKRGEHAMMT